MTWLRQNILAMLVMAGALVGVYASAKVEIASHNTSIQELSLHIKKLDRLTDEIPTLRKDIERSKDEMAEIKPILSSLAEGVHKLNVTLADLNGSLKTSDLRLSNLEKTQERIETEIRSIHSHKTTNTNR